MYMYMLGIMYMYLYCMSYNQALLPGTWLKLNCFAICIYLVYTHCDLGDLSSLVGSLSRTIQHIHLLASLCEFGVFPIFLENDLLKVDKILGLTFLRQEKTWKDSIRRFSIYCSRSFVLDGLFTTPVYSRRRSRFVNSAFSKKKILAQKSKFIYDKQI